MKDFKIGLGCGVKNGLSQEVLERSLALGIRYFDTSTFYPIGAIANFDDTLKRLNINRGTVHLSLKLWLTELGNNRANDHNSNSLSLWSIYDAHRKNFNVQRFDSVVLHWPLTVDADGYPDEFRVAEIWPQLEQLLGLGIISEIGVSNFNIVELQRLLDIAVVEPYSLQIEFNPFAHDSKLVDFCIERGIKVIGHSPFSYGWIDGHRELFQHPVIRTISDKYRIPEAQILLCWAIAKNVIPIPGTTNPDHVDDFLKSTDLEVLTKTDIESIDSLNSQNFHYLDIYNYFGLSFHKKYFSNTQDLCALVYNNAGLFETVSIYDPDFMLKVKEALTEGAGFVILPRVFAESAGALQRDLASRGLNSAGRWNGMGPNINSILNSGSDILEMVDDPFLSLIIEALLGWDCKLDNISLSTSRIAPDNAIFGPHQDSPFDNNPGAPLPPASYPMVLQVIVAIDEFRDDNGPLYVIPHSHKKRWRVNLPWQGNLPNGKIPDGAMKVIAPKGSAIIAVGHIWHGTFPNMSTSPRMGLLMEYVCSVCDARDKFTTDSIKPELLEQCSRRVIRLLNNGKRHQHDNPGLLNAFKKMREDRIPDFAKKRR